MQLQFCHRFADILTINSSESDVIVAHHCLRVDRSFWYVRLESRQT